MKALHDPGKRAVWTAVIVLGGLAVVMSAATVAVQRMKGTLTREAMRDSQEWLDALVDGRAGALEAWLGTGLQMVRSVADYPGVAQLAASTEGRHRVREHLDTMVRSFGVHSAAVYAADGTELVASTEVSDTAVGEVRPFERAAVTATPPVVLERHVSDGVAVTFRLPIRSTASGSSKGLAVLRHYPSRRLLSELAPPAGTTQPVALRLLLQAEDGVIYALSAEGELGHAPTWLCGVVSEVRGQRPAVEPLEGDSLATAATLDRSFLTSFHSIQGADWWLVGMVERRPILDRVGKQLRLSAAVVYLALIALASTTIGAWRHWRALHYRALAGSQARFKAIFEGAPVPLFELDLSAAAGFLEGEAGTPRSPPGRTPADPGPPHPPLTTLIRVESANRAGLELLGVASTEELKGVFGALLPSDAYDLLLEWWSSVGEGAAEFERETKLQQLHGDSREVLVRVRNPEGADPYERVLVSILDLTEARALEEQLRQSQKMEAVGRLAGGVAHDFNNFLQAMLVAAEGLKRATADPAHVDDTAVELGELVRRAGALTRQLLLFSRREPARLEPLDLNETVLGMAKMLRRLVRENIAFSVEPATDRLFLRADRGQLEQVLLNLVLNAVDAMPDGGALVVKTSAGEAGAAVLEVEDTGHGIPPELKGRVFEPFFTTKAAGEGTGLGLSVVHGIVTVHGGRIEVDSGQGRGTVVRIVLPRAAGDLGPTGGGAPDASLPGGHGELILLVEDNTTVRRSLATILESLGYQVAQTGSGEEVALTEDLRPQVLLSDYLLPGITGLQLAEECRGRWPHVRVLLMSGYVGDQRLDEAVKAGKVSFLRKPVPPSELARELRRLLDER